MPLRSALTLADAAASHRDATSAGAALRVQAAFVRSLVDEVECRHPSDRAVAALHEQLGDELGRLAQLAGDPASAPRAATPGHAAEGAALDVLVVDDDEPTRLAAAKALRDMGYSCRTAQDGAEALREHDRSPADIVLSDWSMPGMSGLELCAALKRREPQPYVILATSFHEKARTLDGARGGVDAFLHKPIDLDELELRLLAAARLLRALRASST